MTTKKSTLADVSEAIQGSVERAIQSRLLEAEAFEALTDFEIASNKLADYEGFEGYKPGSAKDIQYKRELKFWQHVVRILRAES